MSWGLVGSDAALRQLNGADERLDIAQGVDVNGRRARNQEIG
jgi:hypothetical protein